MSNAPSRTARWLTTDPLLDFATATETAFLFTSTSIFDVSNQRNTGREPHPELNAGVEFYSFEGGRMFYSGAGARTVLCSALSTEKFAHRERPGPVGIARVVSAGFSDL